MSEAAAKAPVAGESRQSFAEFVALMALMMALTAFSIDIMLPGLPAIGAYYGVADENAPQLVVFAYLAGFALGQPLFGPLSDQYGRKPLLFFGMGVYALAVLAAALAPSFETMLGARFLQGFGGAAGRILAVAIIRDRYAGRAMAEVMSFVMMVFIFAPVVAPSLGAAVIYAGDWRWTFFFLAAFALA
ncbi:MAG: MFS transporter, partial [Pseudomonadota bacterium]